MDAIESKVCNKVFTILITTTLFTVACITATSVPVTVAPTYADDNPTVGGMQRDADRARHTSCRSHSRSAGYTG